METYSQLIDILNIIIHDGILHICLFQNLDNLLLKQFMMFFNVKFIIVATMRWEIPWHHMFQMFQCRENWTFHNKCYQTELCRGLDSILIMQIKNEKMRSPIDRLVLKYLTFHPRLDDQQLISHLTWLQSTTTCFSDWSNGHLNRF